MTESTFPRARVVNLKDEPFDVYIGRAGHGYDGYFGNYETVPGGREQSIDAHAVYFRQRVENDHVFLGRVLTLRGLRLGCHCKPRRCHGDVIAEFVNKVEAAAERGPLAGPGPGRGFFSCSICEVLYFTQMSDRNKQCPYCGRWYCPSHHHHIIHACPESISAVPAGLTF